ncbi:MAG: Wadjet anti-phage system protein JetD domain-containing protein [Candidatus Ozemobacteraceae bacterium]
MSWTYPRDLRAQVQKLWDRGDLLAGLITGENAFPKRLSLKGPTSTEMADRFNEVRAWIVDLLAMSYYRIEKREFTHRLLGTNAVPHAIWIDCLEDALAIIDRRREATRFRTLLDLTRERQPKLLHWLVKRPLQALNSADHWPLLLDIVAWLQAHPRPGIYLRQVDIPGVHSKFIEAHRGMLAELLDLVLPLEAIDTTCTGVARFAARYGFRDKPEFIRFRVLDARLAVLSGIQKPDISLDADSFATLEIPVRRVFITENEINFLAFPLVEDSMVIFGAGYGWDPLAKAQWLSNCMIHYWGDIDTHGFAILDQLRRRFDHVESFLMDRTTLMAHETLWGDEKDQVLHDLPRLTEVERSLFDELRDNRIRKNLRLEQEMVGFGWVETVLIRAFRLLKAK